MRRWLALISLLLPWAAAAQEAAGLVTEAVTVVPEFDIYGQTVLYAEGRLVNQGEDAFDNLSLRAELYDAAGEIIGEGLGYPVNACLAGLLPDFALQPGASQPFAIQLELYEDGAEIARVEVQPQGRPIPPAPPPAAAALPGITQVTDQEVVAVEWIDATSLRFAAGCWRDAFTTWSWQDYELTVGAAKPSEHPKAALVTDRLRRQINLTDPYFFNRAFLQFAPGGRRLVYQTDLNTVVTAEPDGSYRRVLFEQLANRTLQGITWLRDGRFLAYYYGAYGEPVLYFTATVDGQTLSEPPQNAAPSLIVPGASLDGQQIIIGATVDGRTGYYLKRAAYAGLELLFEAELPGSNYPGPLLLRDDAGVDRVYAALPSEDGAQLVCFNRQTRERRDLSPLPLRLATDERARWQPSPDGARIALAVDGLNGGLWLIELAALAACD